MSEPAFTQRELDIMSILWRLGSATVAEVRDELSDDLAYTSVLSALQTLEEKGYIDHQAEGRAYRYRPLIAADAAGGSALTRVLDKIFHGSAEQLLAQLVSERQIAPDELRRMRELLQDRLKEAE